MGKDRKPLGMQAVVALAAILLSAVALAVNVDAARGGKGGGGGKPSNGSATLVVSPNPVPAGTAITISGSGYKADSRLLVGVMGYIPWDEVTTGSDGTFAFTYQRTADPTVFPPGTYYVEAKRESNKGMVTAASTTFTVVP